jgi:hypothetical protein
MRGGSTRRGPTRRAPRHVRRSAPPLMIFPWLVRPLLHPLHGPAQRDPVEIDIQSDFLEQRRPRVMMPLTIGALADSDALATSSLHRLERLGAGCLLASRRAFRVDDFEPVRVNLWKEVIDFAAALEAVIRAPCESRPTVPNAPGPRMPGAGRRVVRAECPGGRISHVLPDAPSHLICPGPGKLKWSLVNPLPSLPRRCARSGPCDLLNAGPRRPCSSSGGSQCTRETKSSTGNHALAWARRTKLQT